MTQPSMTSIAPAECNV